MNHMNVKLATRSISTIMNNKIIFDSFCLSDYEIDQTPISRYSGRSFSEQSSRSSAHESSRTGSHRETDLRFPMDMASKYLSQNWYQKHNNELNRTYSISRFNLCICLRITIA